MPEITHAPEEWRPVPGFEGRYDVSDQGRVRSWLGWHGQLVPRILKAHLRSDDHFQVNLRGEDGTEAARKVHSLVLLAFVGPRPSDLETRHLDGDPSNNRWANLVYGTHSENMLDKVRHGTHLQASRTHCPQGHPYDEVNTYIMPNGVRRCRSCRRARRRQRERADA